MSAGILIVIAAVIAAIVIYLLANWPTVNMEFPRKWKKSAPTRNKSAGRMRKPPSTMRKSPPSGYGAKVGRPAVFDNFLSRVWKRVKSGASEVEALLRGPIQENFLLSIFYPKLLSKGFSSSFKVVIYPDRMQQTFDKKMKPEIENNNIEEVKALTDLTSDTAVIIELSSQEIEFTKAVPKRIRTGLNIAAFSGKPKESCLPGSHTVKLSVSDKETGNEYVSQTFTVMVVDSAFDHVSRLLVSKIASAFLGMGAVVTYAFTLLEQVDKSLGLTSGTVAGAIAVLLHMRFLRQYQQPKASVDVPTQQV